MEQLHDQLHEQLVAKSELFKKYPGLTVGDVACHVNMEKVADYIAKIDDVVARLEWDAELLTAVDYLMLPVERLLDEYRKYGDPQFLRELNNYRLFTGDKHDVKCCLFDTRKDMWGILTAFYGNIGLLMWARSEGCPWEAGISINAVSQGHFALLHWAYDNGCMLSDETCALAAAAGYMDILKWAWPLRATNHWNYRTFSNAAAQGNLDMLMWLQSKGCVLHIDAHHDIYVSALENGHFDTVQWLYANGYKLALIESACSAAAYGGNLAALQWLRQLGCSWDSRTCSNAAYRGHLHVLKWAHENGCVWNSDTCSYAAKGGHLHVLKWAREHGCPWDNDTCAYAAQDGHLDILVWAREHGCPWTSSTRYRAILYPEVVKWLNENGCPE